MDVATKLARRITSIEVDFVELGQVLARMDAQPLEAQLALAQAILYRGAGLSIVWPQLLAILGIGVLFFTGALLRFRKALAQMA
jgi:multidrug efflux pump subunit AcrA (membrane-fusion protein)